MTLPSPRQRVAAGLAAVLLLTLAACTSGSSKPAATTSSAATSSPASGDYLALGDSLAFGYREAANQPTPDYADAARFTGYPEDVAAALGLTLANASCPGETSASLLTAGARSNGCENSATGSAGYRTAYPLHVAYTGTQLAYAIAYLKAHRDTKLVSLSIGANDAFLCQATTADSCAAEFPATLTRLTANVRTLLSDLRRQAGYRGQIVLVTYYATDYTAVSDTASTQDINAALMAATAGYDVTVADGYGLFQQAAEQAGGKTCTAGLLTTLTTGGCGVHPSVAGQALLALGVERVLTR